MDVTLKELPSWPPFSEDRPSHSVTGSSKAQRGTSGRRYLHGCSRNCEPGFKPVPKVLLLSFGEGGGGESFSVLPILAHPDLVLSYYFKPWAFTMDP